MTGVSLEARVWAAPLCLDPSCLASSSGLVSTAGPRGPLRPPTTSPCPGRVGDPPFPSLPQRWQPERQPLPPIAFRALARAEHTALGGPGFYLPSSQVQGSPTREQTLIHPTQHRGFRSIPVPWWRGWCLKRGAGAAANPLCRKTPLASPRAGKEGHSVLRCPFLECCMGPMFPGTLFGKHCRAASKALNC